MTVIDNEAPIITCVPNATRSANGSGKYSIRGHEFDATATDGCGIASLEHGLSGATVDHFESSPLSNEKLNIGITTITWRATDVNGNVSTCTTQVTVTASGSNSPAAQPELPLADQSLAVKVAPNPATSYFTLSFQSVAKEKIKINIVDVSGRNKERFTEIWPNSTLQVGASYRPGVYFAEVTQGNQKVILKLIKEGK